METLKQPLVNDKAENRSWHHTVEMSWDPITRIVGSLGIYTKIDFANKEVVECLQHVLGVSRLQHFYAKQRSARHAFYHKSHLRHLR